MTTIETVSVGLGALSIALACVSIWLAFRFERANARERQLDRAARNELAFRITESDLYEPNGSVSKRLKYNNSGVGTMSYNLQVTKEAEHG